MVFHMIKMEENKLFKPALSSRRIMRSIWIKWRTRDTKTASITVTKLVLFKIIYTFKDIICGILYAFIDVDDGCKRQKSLHRNCHQSSMLVTDVGDSLS